MSARRHIVLGVAGVRRKLDRKPIRAILSSLQRSDARFRIVVLDDVHMQAPVASWPVVDALLAMHSSDFPLDAVLQYVALRSPVLVNNIHMQRFMMDRRVMRHVLSRAGVPVPPAVYLERSAGDSVYQSLSDPDTLVIHNPARATSFTIRKPFVEKPVAASDHNVYIYYKGGGVRRMFRKSKTASSVFDPHVYKVRHTGDFIYEQFFEPKHRADVKVYAVGDFYHAESRKAPHVDGIVERDPSGRERRTPVQLSEQELHICRKVSSAFDQFVIGFDLLRAVDSQHFIIDVNGWSVVKNSDDYCVRAGQILASYIAQKVKERTSEEKSPASPNLLLDASRRSDLFDPSHGRGSPCPA